LDYHTHHWQCHDYIMLAAQYAVACKHQFDENYKPKFIVNEWEVYTIAAFGGSLGLLISYIAFPDIRQDDSLNGHRFLWIALILLALHVTLIVVLSYFGYITFTF
jgi:hypothetical protein